LSQTQAFTLMPSWRQ